MAQRVADAIGDRDIVHVVASPLERAQETAAADGAGPRGRHRHRRPRHRVHQRLRGRRFSVGDGIIRRPSSWPHLWNPFRPSWGEPYTEVAARMMAAVHDARDAARGHEAVVVSHQLPIWTTRLHVEHRSFLHHPRHRQCTLASLTSLVFDGDTLSLLRYSEPAADLIPVKDRNKSFSSGSGPAGDATDQTPPS